MNQVRSKAASTHKLVQWQSLSEISVTTSGASSANTESNLLSSAHIPEGMDTLEDDASMTRRGPSEGNLGLGFPGTLGEPKQSGLVASGDIPWEMVGADGDQTAHSELGEGALPGAGASIDPRLADGGESCLSSAGRGYMDYLGEELSPNRDGCYSLGMTAAAVLKEMAYVGDPYSVYAEAGMEAAKAAHEARQEAAAAEAKAKEEEQAAEAAAAAEAEAKATAEAAESDDNPGGPVCEDPADDPALPQDATPEPDGASSSEENSAVVQEARAMFPGLQETQHSAGVNSLTQPSQPDSTPSTTARSFDGDARMLENERVSPYIMNNDDTDSSGIPTPGPVETPSSPWSAQPAPVDPLRPSQDER